jgi:hypothetical protein
VRPLNSDLALYPRNEQAVTNVLFSGDQMTAEVYEISGRLRD